MNGFFAFPVTDTIAPGYSSIILHPMDFSTMTAKIESAEYANVMEFKVSLLSLKKKDMYEILKGKEKISPDTHTHTPSSSFSFLSLLTNVPLS